MLAGAPAFGSAGGSDLPPIPPIPASNWPSAEVAEPFARELLARVPPNELAHTLAAKPELMPAILRNLGTALMSKEAAMRESIAAYISAVARASDTRDVNRLVTIIVLDPRRYDEDNAFRARIHALLPRAVASFRGPMARAILNKLNESASLDFDTAEAIATAARIAPRTSSGRRIAFDRNKLEMPDDLSGPIDASIFSLSSAYFTPEEGKRFLESVHTASPRRRIVVLGDLQITNATWIDDFSRPFTPWPRDPFIVTRSTDGGVVFVNRPNVQPQREEDQNMVRAIVQELPRSMDTVWKHPQWTVAPTPFHNGHILLTAAEVWISIHTLEPRALQILGLDRVPIETFDSRAGIDRYLGAIRKAAAELQDFYRRPVRFVHALPKNTSSDLMTRLGGGAGFDLDSIVSILPRTNGKTDALIGDIHLGVAVARRASLEEWSVVRKAYGFRDEPELLRDHVIEAQASARTIALQRFLDEVAGELQRDGMTVRRLPLLNVPASLRAGDTREDDFLMTWNNVVLEKRGELLRAEGFASLLASADRYARQTFAASGYRLDLYPPLIRSIVLSGGYRCASNHLRPMR